MNPHSYMQTKSTELAEQIAAAATAVQISAACSTVDSFLRKHTPDQQRWFFSITFPTLICRIFGFDESASSSALKRKSLSGWIDIAASADDSELDGKIFTLLSPNGVLLSSISAVDRLSLVKYIFPAERLPEWVRCMLQIKPDCQVLTELCPLFKNKVMEVLIKGSSNQVQLNVFEYYMFWFAYCPVSRGNSEGSETVKIQQTKKFRLEKWAYSIPGLSSNKREEEKKTEISFYLRLLYSYLRSFVPAYDLNVHQPYHSSLLHYSTDYDISLIERAEFLVNTLIYFWLLDNDFSPFPVGLCKSFGLRFSFKSVLGESPPTSGLGDVVNVFVKYLNLISLPMKDEFNQIENVGSPSFGVPGSVNFVKSRDAALSMHSVGSWNSWIQRPLYRYILRAFLFCPVETSIKNASQISSWECQPSAQQSSLVMHFIGFAHKFLHTDAEVIVQMVAKVINILTSSTELKDLIKNVDTVFHSKPAESSRSHLNTLNRFVPTIRQQLQDWEDGLCETDADGSFLHENWNKDLRLFSDGEDGGQQLLQLFLLRAESELQAIYSNNVAQNLQCLDSLKAQVGVLFGGPITNSSSIGTPRESKTTQQQQAHDLRFEPRSCFETRTGGEIKYKGDWMKRPISNDEIAWLAKLLVYLSGWLNECLGLNRVNCTQGGPDWSYVQISGGVEKVTIKVVLCWLLSWITWLRETGANFMKEHGLRVNLRMLASKKVVLRLLVIAAALLLFKKVFAV
ncbi:unnamed protein product [Fraxinus pennsylvanica]|uniref:Sphingomyelin phosphodiesterase 4 n=1 Tax=Fraxinus pennsylvanica TaxID=56036 RepID=A0AAD1YUW8_9LAMI|nr:unnamed protein product [Fraxinus pennsylvanica]